MEIRDMTSQQKELLKAIEGNPSENLKLISEQLNLDGFITDNQDPSFYSSMIMRYWHPNFEKPLRDNYYRGGSLFVAREEKTNNYSLFNSDKYTHQQADEYLNP